MKKLLFTIIMLLFTLLSYSQIYVNDQNISTLDINYIQLIPLRTNNFDLKVKIYIDYGQKAKFMKSDSIKNINGETKKFNSIVNALNFMYKNGWRFIHNSEMKFRGKLQNAYLLERI